MFARLSAMFPGFEADDDEDTPMFFSWSSEHYDDNESYLGQAVEDFEMVAADGAADTALDDHAKVIQAQVRAANARREAARRRQARDAALAAGSTESGAGPPPSGGGAGGESPNLPGGGTPEKMMSWNEFQSSVKGENLTKAQISEQWTEYKAKLKPRSSPDAAVRAIDFGEDPEPEPAKKSAPKEPEKMMSWNEFQASVKGQGLTKAQISEKWAEYKAKFKARPTWNDLQRQTGGKGFTKWQMSLMWSAYKEGVPSYNAFRTHVKGRGLTREVESAMWAQHKLFGAKGVRAERVSAA